MNSHITANFLSYGRGAALLATSGILTGCHMTTTWEVVPQEFDFAAHNHTMGYHEHIEKGGKFTLKLVDGNYTVIVENLKVKPKDGWEGMTLRHLTDEQKSKIPDDFLSPPRKVCQTHCAIGELDTRHGKHVVLLDRTEPEVCGRDNRKKCIEVIVFCVEGHVGIPCSGGVDDLPDLPRDYVEPDVHRGSGHAHDSD